MTFLTGIEDSLHGVLTFEIVQYKSHNIELNTACTLNFYPRHFRNQVHRLRTVISGTIKPGFHLDFLCLQLLVLDFYCPFWFFPALMSDFAFDCSWQLFLLFTACCCSFWLLIALDVSHPELKHMNENKNENAFCCWFWFWGRVSICRSLLFCCFSLLVLVFQIESVLSQKPKQGGKCLW